MNHAVLPVMRQARHGRIVNLSSVAAPIPIPFQAYYSASKAAINAYTLALANEVRPFGVEVCCVQPGDIRTGFTAAREKTSEGDDVYGGRISRSVGKMEHDEQTGMAPEAAARFICRVATKKGVKPVNTIGFAYQSACVLAKLLSARLLNSLVGKIYAK
jgi:short-subunit dehydrogenase